MDFNKLYPPSIMALDKHHWTPEDVARKVAKWLACADGVKVLDIGSGAGKFCLAAASYTPGVHYYGVEQRKWLVDSAETAKKIMGLSNVTFIHGNFTQLDLAEYDHFYFYNSFYENLTGLNRIDNQIEYSVELYNYYTRYLFRKLRQKPPGTRLCTLCSLEEEVPPGFHVAGTGKAGLLKFWIKV